MANKLSELVAELKRVSLQSYPRLSWCLRAYCILFTTILLRFGTRPYNGRIQRTMQHYFGTSITYLARCRCIKRVFIGLDNIDEAIKFSTAATGVNIRCKTRKSLLMRWVNCKHHMAFTVGNRPGSQKNTSYVLSCSVACALNYEVRTTTQCQSCVSWRFLNKRGK